MRASVVYLKLYYTTERKRRGKDAIALPTLGAARPQVGQEHPCSAVGDFQLFFFVVLQYNFHGFVSCGIFHHAGKLIRSNEKVDYYFSYTTIAYPTFLFPLYPFLFPLSSRREAPSVPANR